MRWLRDCVNCGKQVILDGSDVKCYWCGESATEKVEGAKPLQKEAEIMVTQEERAKFEAMSNREKGRWIEAHKEEIVASIRSGKSRKEVVSDYPFTRPTLHKFMQLYTPELIGKKLGFKPKKEEDTGLTEHEHLLILVGYQMAVREYLASFKGG